MSAIAYITFRFPTTLFVCVYTAWRCEIIEYGAARCSAKWTIVSGWKSRTISWVKSGSHRSPT